MAGTAMACLVENEVGNTAALSAYVAVGYTFGNFAALGFGRHFPSLLSSSVRCIPKLFIMGDKDEFTSVNQLEDMAQKIIDQNRNEGSVDVEIVPNVGHFELESPKYDLLVSRLVLDWLDKHL
jgi:pimeloyl-ACP methyl ester carboxylesterase